MVAKRELLAFIADEVGLSNETKARYVKFMMARFRMETYRPYLKEWAERFRDGREYAAADKQSTMQLVKIDKK